MYIPFGMSETLQALIFDVDGTLAETEEWHRVAFNRAFVEFDIPWHWDHALYVKLLEVTGGKERLRHYAAAVGYEGLDVAVLHRRKTEIYGEVMATGGDAVCLRPGVEEMIRRARKAGLRLAVATTTSRINVDRLLTATLGAESIGWFDAFSCGEDAVNKKPDPALYNVALDRLELPAAACIAIEDSGQGLGAALAAGIPTVVAASIYTGHHDFSGAAYVCDGLDKLLKAMDAGRIPREIEVLCSLADRK